MIRPQRKRSRTEKSRRLLFETMEVRRLLAADFQLQILHASDLEGGVDAIGNAPNFSAIVDGLEQQAAVDGVPSILLSAGDNYIPGPFFNAAGDRDAFRDSGLFNEVYNELFGVATYDGLREGNGRVDVSIMNVLGFDASAIGNHEFDASSDAFATIIEPDFRGGADGPPADRWVGAQFPYLSANLDFSGDGALSGLFTSDLLMNTEFASGPTESASGDTEFSKIAPGTIIDAGGEMIGVVGATTQLIGQISSPSGTVDATGGADDMNALAGAIQPVVDQFTGMGIDKVVLVSHLQQIALEEELAAILDGVDVIIAGGSDTLLANPDDTLQPGDVAGDSYPIISADASGMPTVIVSTAGEYSYVGQLTLDFDVDGNLIGPDMGPLDDLSDLDLTKNGPVASTSANVDAIWAGLAGSPFAVGNKAELVERLTDAVTDVVIAADGNVFGQTDLFINGAREDVRTQETNLGNLTADANLSEARKIDSAVDISLKNGGGIRASIGDVIGDDGELVPPQANPLSGKLEGEISQLDIDNALRFNNGLTLVTVDAAELKDILEHAVAGTAPGATPGQFAQVGGFKFSFDPTGDPIEFNTDADIALGAEIVKTPGSRVHSVALTDDHGNVTDVLVEDGVVLDPAREIRMVTLDFLWGAFSPADSKFGGDGYPIKGYAEDVVQLGDEIIPDGDATFASTGSEQDALAEYLLENFPADSVDVADAQPSYADADMPAFMDMRIQNIAERGDTVVPQSYPNTLVVTNGADFGAGSFREAVTIANENSNVRKIVISKDVDVVTLDKEVVYKGVQDLQVAGKGAVLLASDVFAGEAIFKSISGSADLTFKHLTVDGDFDPGETAANGILVAVPSHATGTLTVDLQKVFVVNAGLHGVHIADQLNNSDATMQLLARDSVFANNGIGALDFDGIRVDEGGEGYIIADIRRTSVDENGGDGLELDERGAGGVIAKIFSTSFDENGFFNEEDLDDGFDIDEAGDGGINALLRRVTANGNLDEGIDFDEDGSGSTHLNFMWVEASGNTDEGIKATEDDDGEADPGSIHAYFHRVTANNNGDDGIELEELGPGNLGAVFSRVTASNNGDAGVQLAETGDGRLNASIFAGRFNGNDDHGVLLEESGSGSLFASLVFSELEDNDGFGICAVELDGGVGWLFELFNDFGGNSDGPKKVDSTN